MAPSYLPISTQDLREDDLPLQRTATKSSLTEPAHMATTTLKVEGMTCGACTSAVEGGFSGVGGVGHVSVSLVMERAVVQHDPLVISAEAVREIIEDRGFDAEVLSTDLPSTVNEESDEEETTTTESSFSVTTLSVGGMTCGACTSAVEGAFKDIAGVKSFSISLLSERVVLEHDPKLLSPERIVGVIEDTGFDASIVDTKVNEPAKSTKNLKRKTANQASLCTTTIAIEGMTCGACTSAVEGGFKKLDGLIQLNISLLAERAVVVHDKTKLTSDQIAEIIEDCGFDARILSATDADSNASSASIVVHFKIYGMQDESAATELERTLGELPGVDSAKVNLKTTRAMLQYQPAIIGLRALVEAVEKAGFNALLAESDDNNAQLESLAKTKEIQTWRRDFKIALGFAIPVFLTSMIFPMFVPPLNYGAIKLPLIPGLWLGDVMCLLLTIPVQFGVGRRFYVTAWKSLKHGSPTMDVLVTLGTSAAFFYSVAAMLISIIFPPHTRPATVFDTCTMLITFVTLGRLLENGAKSQTSMALSRLMSLAPSMATIYVDAIAAEKLAEGKTTHIPSEKDAHVSEKTPNSADARGEMAAERVIPTELIQVGDIVVLRPGDKIPADGTVLSGESYTDESMVTGEAMPVRKKPGSKLMAGTVNGAGRLDFKVTRAGRDTQLSQIVRLVQEAQTSRAPIQRMADKVAGYFVPIIIALGATTFVSWMVLSHVLQHPPEVFNRDASGGRFMICLKLCISVIVFACPCALGLSTPTAVMVGTGVGAEQGILVKGGAALEQATKINHVVFDKTGTLTTGKMDVSNTDLVYPPSGTQADWERLWWTLVGLAESSSEHPIGRAIVRAAKTHLNLQPDGNFSGSINSFEATVGKGISASICVSLESSAKTHHILIGNSSFMRSNMIVIPNPSEAFRRDSTVPMAPTTARDFSPSLAGTTVIHTAINNHYAGSISLSDTLKTSAAAAVRALAYMNISSSIVTGDAIPTALAIASLVGISPSNVHASCSPDRKQAIIREMQSRGLHVAMVGDGINDSPALATADIGISLSSGTDVAMEAADVVLMRPEDLLDVPAAFHLSKTIFRRIKLNLAWACGYNAIGLPFAMGFFLPWGVSLHPMAAGAAMALSSVSVVSSSLLLKRWKRPRWMGEGGVKPVKVGLAERVDRMVQRLGLRVVVERMGLRKQGQGQGDYVPLRDVEGAEDAV